MGACSVICTNSVSLDLYFFKFSCFCCFLPDSVLRDISSSRIKLILRVASCTSRGRGYSKRQNMYGFDVTFFLLSYHEWVSLRSENKVKVGQYIPIRARYCLP